MMSARYFPGAAACCACMMYVPKSQGGGSDVPTLVSLEEERADAQVLDYGNRTARQDLIIVPATQISPSGICSPTPEEFRWREDSQRTALPLNNAESMNDVASLITRSTSSN